MYLNRLEVSKQALWQKKPHQSTHGRTQHKGNVRRRSTATWNTRSQQWVSIKQVRGFWNTWQQTHQPPTKVWSVETRKTGVIKEMSPILLESRLYVIYPQLLTWWLPSPHPQTRRGECEWSGGKQQWREERRNGKWKK